MLGERIAKWTLLLVAAAGSSVLLNPRYQKQKQNGWSPVIGYSQHVASVFGPFVGIVIYEDTHSHTHTHTHVQSLI